uniref:Uncharacterized protein n=1 Tax=Chenopodium quinoa TaxID=63459 RepID=A0A803LVL6_CHEQI
MHQRENGEAGQQGDHLMREADVGSQGSSADRLQLVHQVYYSQDPLEKDIQYVMKRVSRDLFDFEEALNEETYWEEPIDSSSNNMPSFDANHIHVGAGGGEVGVVNIDDLSDSEDV